MDVFSKHSIYSNIEIVGASDDVNSLIATDYSSNRIISMGFTDRFIIVEYIPDDKWEQYIADKQANTTPANNDADNKPKVPAKVKQAYDTILNTDPFNMGVKGLTLAEIYEKHPDWVEKARADLLNTFILGKMQIIDEYLGG